MRAGFGAAASGGTGRGPELPPCPDGMGEGGREVAARWEKAGAGREVAARSFQYRFFKAQCNFRLHICPSARIQRLVALASSPSTLSTCKQGSPAAAGAQRSAATRCVITLQSVVLQIHHESCQHGIVEGLEESLRTAKDFSQQSRAWSSTVSFSDLDEKGDMNVGDDYTDSKRELRPQTVDPKKGWEFRGVHRAIICGKVGQVPVQKILRNGRTVTVFTVGTGGMFDQRVIGPEDLPKPAQWHRIAVHNDSLGAYAVQKLVKNSAVYIEGDIETRVYNDSLNDQVRNIPEICVRRDGKIRLVKSGDSAANISLDELREGLFQL